MKDSTLQGLTDTKINAQKVFHCFNASSFTNCDVKFLLTKKLTDNVAKVAKHVSRLNAAPKPMNPHFTALTATTISTIKPVLSFTEQKTFVQP